MAAPSRIAVVLFNLGGPDGAEAVKPFLFNLFNDPAIIGAPSPVRWALAKWISARRAPVAREIYARIGGKSPLLELTRQQACALETAASDEAATVRAFIAMRYWHPMSAATVAEVQAFAPDRIVLLPLYPQYSTTTTESSVRDWKRAAAAVGLDVPTSTVCCYPDEPGLIEALAGLIAPALDEAAATGTPRLLFSAHGLPKKIVDRGDPYAWQVEKTARAVVGKLARPGLDSVVCYQSRVGPLEWIGPSTEDELARAGVDKVPVVVVPIAFVSEHSETLVELDIEYREKAHEFGVSAYLRVAAVGTDPAFIDGLVRLVRVSAAREPGLAGGNGGRICDGGFACCAQNGRI